MFKYFRNSILVTVIGLAAGAWLDWRTSGTVGGAATTLFLVFVLSILEISLSFDNAVVNATVLKKMTPLWQHRFLTWGILIAVFGMRLIFPLAIVAILVKISPWEAIRLAANDPDEYARLMLSTHVPVAAFGGAFLFMVALKYFFDKDKEVHWIYVLEEKLTKLGKLEAIEVVIGIGVLLLLSRQLAEADQLSFLTAGIGGLATFLLVDGISSFLEAPNEIQHDIHRASVGMFLYLEVLDASFSFDGVVGAFAISNNLFVIAIGLGVGAMFVRSLTIMLVEHGTLAKFRYLEHGAFYAIGALAVIMFANTLFHIPEVITGLIGAGLIGASLISSIRHARGKKPLMGKRG